MPDATGEGGLDPGRQWMLAFQQGDDAAFTALVRHYGARIVAFFRRGGADAAAAEDLAQEALLRIARARDRYEPTAKFTTWLHRILFRIALNDSARNRWRRAVGFGAGGDDATDGVPEPEAEESEGPGVALEQSERREAVRAAVASLPEPQRTALLLHRFEHCSYEEVATTLGLSLPALKSLLFRARENLKRRLEEVDHGL